MRWKENECALYVRLNPTEISFQYSHEIHTHMQYTERYSGKHLAKLKMKLYNASHIETTTYIDKYASKMATITVGRRWFSC